MATNNAINLKSAGVPVYDGAGTFASVALAKGQLLTYDDNLTQIVALPKGSDGQALTVNDAEDTGLEWINSATTDFHDSRYIVSAGGAADGANYTTIATAYAAAVSAGGKQTVMIQPGTYTENITLVDDINLTAHSCDPFNPTVTIVGKLSMATAGEVSISNIRLETNGDYFLEITGSSASKVNVFNCFLNCTDNTGFAHNASSVSATLSFYNCYGDILAGSIAYFTKSSNAPLNMTNCKFLSFGGDNTQNTHSAGNLFMNNVELNSRIASTGAAGINGYFVRMDTGNNSCITFDNTSAAAFRFCEFDSGSATTFTQANSSNQLQLHNVIINTSNSVSISGIGQVTISGMSYYASASPSVTVTTQRPRTMSNDAIKVVSPGAYPYTAQPQDALILVDTSTARTINLNSSPWTGQKYRIKDDTGSAGSNNITITPASGNIDGAASYTIAINYGSVDVVYTGSQWVTL